jgi:hypothetical protein
MQASDKKKGSDIQTRGFPMKEKGNDVLAKQCTHNLI